MVVAQIRPTRQCSSHTRSTTASLGELRKTRHYMFLFDVQVIAATVNQATVANDRGALGARGSLSLSGAPSWCEQSLSAPTVWQKVESQPQTVLGKPDVHVCSVLDIPVTDSQMDVAYIQTVIETPSKPWVQLFQALLLDCDAGFWKQSGIQDLEHICLAQTAALRASCNQW